MTKLIHALFTNVLEQLKSPDAQRMIQTSIVRPVILTVLNMIYPYLLGIMALWIIMFICVALILLILVRGSLVHGGV